jgi:hypothetical protein
VKSTAPWKDLNATVRYRLEARWERFVCTGRGARTRPTFYLELEVQPPGTSRAWKRSTKIPAWLYCALQDA